MRTERHLTPLSSLLLASTVALLASCAGSPEDTPGTGEDVTGSLTSPVINGTPVPASVAMAKGLIRFDNNCPPHIQHLSSGVLVTENFVLGSKHAFTSCISATASTDSWLSSPIAGWADEGAIIPDSDHDMVLVRLPSPFPQTVDNRLSTYADDHVPGVGSFFIGQNLTCYGYGDFSPTAPFGEGPLREGVMKLTGYHNKNGQAPFLPVEEEPALYPSTLLEVTRIFGINQSLGHGDSGGPCFGRDEFNEPQIVGLVERGLGPAPYTRAGLVRGTAFSSKVANIVYRELIFSKHPLFLPAVVSPIASTYGWNESIVLADLTGDGLLDYVLIGASSIFTKIATGGGSFGPLVTTALPLPVNQARTTLQKLYNHIKFDSTSTAPLPFSPYDAYDWVEVQPDRVVTRKSLLSGSFQAPVTTLLGPAPAGSPGWDNGRTFFTNVTGDKLEELLHIGTSSITIRTNLGTGEFSSSQATLQYPGQNWASTERMFFADINGNDSFSGKDFVYVDVNSVTVLPNQMNGGFGNPVVTPLSTIPNGILKPAKVDFRDVNGDGREDLIYGDSRAIYVALGNANSTFSQPVRSLFEYSYDWDLRQYDFRYSITDVTGDQKADFVMQSHDRVWIKPGRGDGTFGRMQIGSFVNTTGVAVDDVLHCEFANVSGLGSANTQQGGLGSADDRICITSKDLLVFPLNNEIPRGDQGPPERVDYTLTATDQLAPWTRNRATTVPPRVRVRR